MIRLQVEVELRACLVPINHLTYKSGDLKPVTYKSRLFGCHLTYKSPDTPSHTNQHHAGGGTHAKGGDL